MLMYNLPSKILCRVLNVQLKAEPDTNEMFAQVTLLPLKEDENKVEKEPMPSPLPCFHVHSFCKTLTASDTSTHGGFLVLRQHADECLPPLDRSRQPPTQELAAKDLHGNEWRFRHIFRGGASILLTYIASERIIPGHISILSCLLNSVISPSDQLHKEQMLSIETFLHADMDATALYGVEKISLCLVLTIWKDFRHCCFENCQASRASMGCV